ALAQARGQAPAPWAAVMDAAIALQSGEVLAARELLARQLAAAAPAAAPLPAWLMQSDLQLMDGDGAAAAQTLRTALQHWPAHPALVAQLARAQMLSDRVEDATATLAPAQGTVHAEIALVRAELARRRGDAPATLAAYTEATRLAGGDARGWQGLGSAHTEREDSGPARASLKQALALAPQSPGAWGELGTLETFANQFTEAGQAFNTALGENPADYVALTGQGLLHLKQGQPQAALDVFLRAGVMEPRYARAKTWTAVAYYQLGRHQDALATLHQASALDDKDPVPYMLLAQIHTDLFQPGEAVEAARAAVERMPYLKSLKQVANDQKGSANLGASLAFFGMEDWALELAQQSFYPYWGGSHLFLADRYPGEFNKNSALFQGFLTDPMAFGASQRYSSLLQRPGAHGAVGVTLDKDLYRMRAPAVTLNGMDNTHVPVSWFFKAQSANASEFPFDLQVNDAPAVRGGYGDVRARAVTVGAGMQPTERINLFAYVNQFDMRLRSQNLFETSMDNKSTQGALGMSYRWGPTEQTWIKLGRSVEDILLLRYPTLYLQPPFVSLMGVSSEPKKQFTDLQLRHTVDTAPGSRWSVALEHVRERQNNLIAGEAAVGANIPGVGEYRDYLLVDGYNRVDRRYTALTLATTQRLDPALNLDAALGLQQIRHRVDGLTQSYLVNLDHFSEEEARRAEMERVVTPRVGLVWQPAQGTTVRMAYQDWLRPLSVSTLTSVETAGIPVEDRLVEAGGRHKRTVAQVGLELGASTFLSLRADHLRVRNPGTVGVDLRTPSLPFLEEMRNAQLVNLSTTDLLEDTPSFDSGTLKTLGAGLNHMFSRRWSGYAKYLYQGSESRSYDADVPVGRIPYIPRHTLAVGATWASPQRLYLSGRAVYRSERFEDKENLTRIAPGWGVDLMGFWESQDKHWVVGVAAMNLWAPKSDRRKTRYVLDARYRF
ncbi:TonB-dependent receptor domain-containing protein, partial [Acidovorax sp. sif0732]